jgi:hypothetical protein
MFHLNVFQDIQAYTEIKGFSSTSRGLEARPAQHFQSHMKSLMCDAPPPPNRFDFDSHLLFDKCRSFFLFFFLFSFSFLSSSSSFFFLSNLITFSFVNWTGILIQENCSLHKPPVFACWSRSLLVLCRMIVM